MKKPYSAGLIMTLSMLIFGTLAPFVRNIPVSSGELALYRAVLAAVLIGGYLLLTKQPVKISITRKDLVLLLLSGAAMGLNWILLFEAYRYTTVSAATLSYYFAPLLVMILSPVIFKEKITGKQILCFTMATVGLILITGTSVGGSRDLWGISFGLGAAVFYAGVMLLNKLIRQITGIHRTLIQFLSAIAVLIPYVVCTGGFNLVNLQSVGWISLLIVGLIHTGVCYCMYFSALKELPGQKAAILSYIDPLSAVLVSVIWLRESITSGQIIGGVLILGFTLWSELQDNTKFHWKLKKLWKKAN